MSMGITKALELDERDRQAERERKKQGKKVPKKTAKNAAKQPPSLVTRLRMPLNVNEFSDQVGTIIRVGAKLDAISEALALLIEDRAVTAYRAGDDPR